MKTLPDRTDRVVLLKLTSGQPPSEPPWETDNDPDRPPHCPKCGEELWEDEVLDPMEENWEEVLICYACQEMYDPQTMREVTDIFGHLDPELSPDAEGTDRLAGWNNGDTQPVDTSVIEKPSHIDQEPPTDKRKCPQCGATSDQYHIYAVLGGITGPIYTACCACSRCEMTWTEEYNTETGERTTRDLEPLTIHDPDDPTSGVHD